jgi:hypothetical protein
MRVSRRAARVQALDLVESFGVFLDPAAVAPEVAAALTPFLPILTGAANHVSEALGAQLGEGAVSWAGRVWARLTDNRLSGSNADELEAVAEQAAAAPDDPDALAAFRWQVRRRLEADSRLLADVKEMLAQVPPAITSGDRAVAIGGTTTETTIITGDNNILR